MKQDRGAHRKFWKQPIRGTKVLFCVCGLKCFSPLRGTKLLFCGCGLKCFSPLRGTKILFCVCGLNCFSPLRGTKILFCVCGLKCFSPQQSEKASWHLCHIGKVPGNDFFSKRVSWVTRWCNQEQVRSNGTKSALLSSLNDPPSWIVRIAI